MRELSVSFVSVPMKVVEGALVRPNTRDTLDAWIALDPVCQSAVVVSSQPFCGYQFAIVKNALPTSMDFDVVGPEADPYSHPAAAAITLDSVARWLFEQQEWNW